MSVPRAQFEDVWKSYPRWLPGRRSIRAMASPRIRATARSSGTRWALRDVTFDLHDGEGLGLIGANGAGKSTLLRLASGLSHPTRGSIGISADVASVLSLGAAFNADLTGRENALTATLLAGIRRTEARHAVPAALDFAELESFADAPVRAYSDGMKLRLAFGVVAQLEPGLLLLDEVIAVGDLRFQEKCMARIAELRSSGTSFLFASHDLDQITEQCDRGIWLHEGSVRALGEVGEVVEEYREAMHSETFDRTPEAGSEASEEGLVLRENRFGSQEVTIEDVRLGGSAPGRVEHGGPLSVSLRLHREGGSVASPVVGISIHRSDTEGADVVCCEASTDLDGVLLGDLSGELLVKFLWEDVELLPGEYLVDVGVYESNWSFAYDYHWHVYPLRVLGDDTSKAVFRPRNRKWTIERV